jgi:hypothetical protein
LKKKKKKKKKKLQLIEQRIIRRTCTATATDFRGRSLEEEEAGVVGAGEATAAAEGKWRHLRDGKDTAASLESQWYAAEAAAGVGKDGAMRTLAGSSNRRDAIVVVVAIADHTATKCKWRVRIATHTRVLGSFAVRLSSPP